MNVVSVNVEVECPACESRDWQDVDALVESGGVPQNHLKCRDCGADFILEAVLDMSARVIGAHQ